MFPDCWHFGRYCPSLFVGRMKLLLWLSHYLAVVWASSNSKSRSHGAFLTPLIQSENFTEARNASSVDFFMEHAGVEAHSGYITVQNGSHLYFLLLKAPEGIRDKAPLILWLQGGPGKSGFFGQFLENGPLGLDANGTLYNRSCTFQKNASILYVDYPAGGGLSIIERRSVLSRSLANVTDDLLRFLQQFYKLFQEFKSIDLYIAGESYGARAAVSLAKRMLDECKTIPAGLILSAGFLTPVEESILKVPEFIYQLGLLDAKGRHILAQVCRNISRVAKTNTTEAALLLGGTFFNFKIGGRPSVFAKLTGYSDQGSILHTRKPDQVAQYEKYANSTDFKSALHVHSSVSLEQYRLAIQFALAPNDYFNNITDILQSVLENFRVLIISGQMDDIFPAVLFQEYLQNMAWNGSTEFAEAPRLPWQTLKREKELAGYVKKAGNVVDAFVLKAGHNIGLDACDAVYDLVYRFINNISYTNPQ